VCHDIIAAALNKVQSDCCTIADAVECWLDLLDSMEQSVNVSETVMDRANIRSTSTLENPAFLAANIADHRYQGRRLSTKQLETGLEFITVLKPVDDIRPALTQFLAKAAPYGSPLLSSDVPQSCGGLQVVDLDFMRALWMPPFIF